MWCTLEAELVDLLLAGQNLCDIRGPGRGVGVSVPCFIRFDIKGASHFTLDGLNYFILFVCWGAWA